MSQQQPRIVLYSTRQCGYCRQAKAFLQQRGLRFTEYDLARNRRAQAEFQRSGSRGVPMIMVGGRRLDGFDPKRLSRLLRDSGFDV